MNFSRIPHLLRCCHRDWIKVDVPVEEEAEHAQVDGEDAGGARQDCAHGRSEYHQHGGHAQEGEANWDFK